MEANRRKDKSMYKVIVDIAPKIIPGTNGCHKYVYGVHKERKEAEKVASAINAATGFPGVATIIKE